ncbi:Polyketide synthase PksM [Bacillus megaterium]|nr:Polyketide synthase PksM [Priestia megaterium]
MNFKVLDIEKDVHSQGIDAGEYDIVLATNVLHATRNIRTTLSHAKGLLKKHGWLVINEITDRFDYLTMTFGLLEGWWLYEDGEDRIANTPLLNYHIWKEILRKKGFEETVVLGQDITNKAVHQNIIIAESNGEIIPYFTNHEIDGHREEGVSKSSLPSHANIENESQSNKSSIKRTKPKDIIQDHIINTLADILQIDKEEFDLDTAYTDFGVDSILAVRFINQINENLKISLRSTDLFNYSTIEQLTNYILKNESFSYVLVNESREEPLNKYNDEKAIDILRRVESGELETDKAVLLLMEDEYA